MGINLKKFQTINQTLLLYATLIHESCKSIIPIIYVQIAIKVLRGVPLSTLSICTTSMRLQST